MITDEIVEAMNLMVSLCDDIETKKGMRAMSEMLCDLNIDEWMNQEHEMRCAWVSQFIPAVTMD